MVSLKKRLQPRLEQLKRAGLVVDAGWLCRMAMYTDVQWQTGLVFQTKKLGKTLRKPQCRQSLDEEESKQLIQLHPQIPTCYSPDKHDPILAFYIGHLGVQDAKRLANKFLSILTASVEEQLKPRMEQFEQSGLVLHPLSLIHI